MAATPTRVAFETDLEPDDVVALLMLVCRYASTMKVAKFVFVVGEGDAADKVCIARVVVPLVQAIFPAVFASYEIVQGMSTGSHKYPTTHLPQEWFANKPDTLCRDDVLKSLECIYSEPFDEIYLLKPPREIVELVASSGKVADAQKNAVVHAYGGFNWRASRASADALNTLASAFKSFAHYHRSDLLPEHISTMDVEFDDTKPLGHALRRIIINWNSHILRKYRDVRDALPADSAQYRDCDAFIRDVEGREHAQVVIADMLAVSARTMHDAKMLRRRMEGHTPPLWIVHPDAAMDVVVARDGEFSKHLLRLMIENEVQTCLSFI